MSARLASSPGRRLRCLTLGAAISSLHTSRTSSAVSRKRLKERGGSPPDRGLGHGGHGVDGARRADRHLEAVPGHLAAVGRQRRAHEPPARRHRARVQPLTGEEAVGQPDRSQLEAAGGEHLSPLADQDLGRAAADVAQEQPAVEHRHGLQHAEVDEAGLLHAGDDLDLDARLLPRRGDELGVVLRLPDRARGDRPDRSAVDVGDLLHAAQRLHAPGDGVGLQSLHVTPAGAEAHHLLLAGDDLEAVLARHPGHDEVEAVGADVDGGERLRVAGHGAEGTAGSDGAQRPQLSRPVNTPLRNEPMRARAASADSSASSVNSR